jgi:hypothetical protein
MKKFTQQYRHLFLGLALLFCHAQVFAQYTGGSGKGDTLAQSIYTQKASASIGVYTSTWVHPDGDTIHYSGDGNFDGDIDSLMASIADEPGTNVFGSTTITTSCYANAMVNKTERYFVPRKTRIMPSSNGDAYLSLYFTQNDFNTYNSQATYQLKVPLDSADVLNNKANIKLMVSSGSMETVNLFEVPSTNVIWHSNGDYWEVRAPIIGGIQGDYMLTTPFKSLFSADPVMHFAQTPEFGDTIATVMIVWPPITGAIGYEMRIRKQGTTTWTYYSLVDALSELNLGFSTNFEVQVRVKENGTDWGEYTPIYTFSTPFNPSFLPDCLAPTNITATNIGPQSVTITWDTAFNGASYFVYIKLASDTSWANDGGGTLVSGTSLTFNSLSPNTAYEFRVRTKCITGTTQNINSLFSPIYEFTTTTPLPGCLPPTGISAVSPTPSSVIIRWDDAQLATQYHVTLMPATQVSWVGSGGTTVSGNSVEFKYLTPQTDYKYKIRSVCPVGTSSGNYTSLFSDVYTFRTGFSGKPAVNETTYFYPNPTNNFFTVDFLAKNYEPMTLSVFDVTGRLLQTMPVACTPGRNQAKVSLKGYVQGMYVIQLIQNDEIKHVGRVLKED